MALSPPCPWAHRPLFLSPYMSLFLFLQHVARGVGAPRLGRPSCRTEGAAHGSRQKVECIYGLGEIIFSCDARRAWGQARKAGQKDTRERRRREPQSRVPQRQQEEEEVGKEVGKEEACDGGKSRGASGERGRVKEEGKEEDRLRETRSATHWWHATA